MPAEAIRIRGMRELQAALARAERSSRAVVRGEFRMVAEPVRREAETLAHSSIRRMPMSPLWSRMRVGVTRTVVYVAPRMRGTKSATLRRPNLAGLLLRRAMEPALDRHAGEIERDLEEAFDRIADRFNHGGI